MKTPDQIKKGLDYCSRLTCGEKSVDCPYECGNCECIAHLAGDALALIQQLVEEGEAAIRRANALMERVQQLEAERDAALADISKGCFSCKHGVKEIWEEPCNSCRRTGGNIDYWEWRGVQQEVNE